uniref:Odorant-binding protein 5 n=1 Tax=Chouioia cunea TaxID=1570515 RepID=A0A6B9CJK8_9HYME|nr:odorant-binding protein 5 [Chouioia cunea]
MHSFTVIVVFCALFTKNALADSYNVELTEEDREIFKKCIKEGGLTKEELNAAVRNFDKNADRKVKCFRGCLLRSHKVIKDDNTIDGNAAVNYYHVEDVEPLKKLILKCSASTTGNDYCDVAQSVESCFRASDIEN